MLVKALKSRAVCVKGKKIHTELVLLGNHSIWLSYLNADLYLILAIFLLLLLLKYQDKPWDFSDLNLLFWK